MIVPATFSRQDRWDGRIRKRSLKQFYLDTNSSFMSAAAITVNIWISEIQSKLEGSLCSVFAFKDKDENWLKSFWKHSALTAKALWKYVGGKSFGEKKLSFYSLNVSHSLLSDKSLPCMDVSRLLFSNSQIYEKWIYFIPKDRKRQK